MSKSLDPQFLVKTFLDVAQKSFETTGGKLIATDPATHKPQNIIEYQGRMSVTGMDKFNGPTHIAALSFYLNDQDKTKRRAKGAIALYLEASNTDKVLRAFGHSVNDDDEEEGALDACGKICKAIAANFRDALAQNGCPVLVLSDPVTGKNSIPDGIDFSTDQSQKSEFSFYFWRKKSMVIDVTMADIARR
jgi:hypothetical protein